MNLKCSIMKLKYEFISDNEFLLKFKKYGQIEKDESFRKELKKKRQFEQEEIYHDLMSKYFLWSKFIILTEQTTFDHPLIIPATKKKPKITFQNKEYEANYLIDDKKSYSSFDLFVFKEQDVSKPMLWDISYDDGEKTMKFSHDDFMRRFALEWNSSNVPFQTSSNRTWAWPSWHLELQPSKIFVSKDMMNEFREWAADPNFAVSAINPNAITRIITA